MRKIPLKNYPPFARKAIIFLGAAKTTNEATNRAVGSEEVSFYLLSHAIELSIKVVAQKATGRPPPRIHDKEDLAEQFKKECGFSQNEITTIIKLKNLNDGPGGLRYDNQPVGKFLPATFKKGVGIVERLLEKFE